MTRFFLKALALLFCSLGFSILAYLVIYRGRLASLEANDRPNIYFIGNSTLRAGVHFELFEELSGYNIVNMSQMGAGIYNLSVASDLLPSGCHALVGFSHLSFTKDLSHENMSLGFSPQGLWLLMGSHLPAKKIMSILLENRNPLMTDFSKTQAFSDSRNYRGILDPVSLQNVMRPHQIKESNVDLRQQLKSSQVALAKLTHKCTRLLFYIPPNQKLLNDLQKNSHLDQMMENLFESARVGAAHHSEIVSLREAFPLESDFLDLTHLREPKVREITQILASKVKIWQ